MTVYFEDLAVGDTEAFGNHTVTREGIVDFAEQFDPQPFHVDPEAARESPFGGLVASGWQTASLTMRLLVEEYLSTAATHGALGVDGLRWRAPVRPGDTLTVETEVVATDDWSDTAGKADVRIETDADDDVAMTMTGLVLFERREPLNATE